MHFVTAIDNTFKPQPKRIVRHYEEKLAASDEGRYGFDTVGTGELGITDIPLDPIGVTLQAYERGPRSGRYRNFKEAQKFCLSVIN